MGLRQVDHQIAVIKGRAAKCSAPFVYVFPGERNTTGEVITMNCEHNPEIPHPTHKKKHEVEAPIPARIYPVIDNDLARDNVENDLPAADKHEL